GLQAPDAGPGDTVVSARVFYCNICSHEWSVPLRPVGRFTSIEDVVQRTGLRRDELTTLADIGALNSFTHERRSALWQVERAVRAAGDLFKESESGLEAASPASEPRPVSAESRAGADSRAPTPDFSRASPLPFMTPDERLQADYAGMGLTIGPHPM